MPDAPIRLGLLVDRSGAYGVEALAAAEHAVALVSRDDAFRGRPIELLAEDALAPAAAAAVERVAAKGACVIVGSPNGPASLAAAPVAVKHGLPYWEMTAAADALTERGWPGVFRLSAPGSAYGAIIARYTAEVLAPGWGAAQSGIRFAVVRRTADPFAQPLAAGLARVARERGLGEVVERTLDRADDEPAMLEELARLRPDVVVLVKMGATTATLWSSLARARCGVRGMFANAGWGNDRNVVAAGEFADATHTVSMPGPGSFSLGWLTPAARAELERWMRECGSRGEMHAREAAIDRDYSFSGLLVLLRGVLARARDLSPAAIVEAARAVDIPQGGTAIGAGIRFDASGANERALVAIRQWQDGRHPVVYPEWMALAKPRIPR